MDVKQWLGNDNELGLSIWENKYKYENETFDEWLDRVSNGDEELKQLIIEKKFLFGGKQ
jgi:ribonucleoside-diphosphate reductase alpha chain